MRDCFPLTSWAAIFSQIPGALPVPVVAVVVLCRVCGEASAAMILFSRRVPGQVAGPSVLASHAINEKEISRKSGSG